MPSYNYKGRDRDGELVIGHIEAEDSTQAAQKLFARNIVPVNIVVATSFFSGSVILKKILAWHPKASREEVIAFCRQMATLYKAGVPLIQAVTRMQETQKSRAMDEALQQVAIDLQSGISLASALRKHPRAFSDFVVNLIEVGENTGKLDQSFVQIAQYLETEENTIRRFKTVMRYPVIVFIALAIALVVLNIFVIPVFVQIFKGMDNKLPMITLFLIGMSNFMVAGWPFILLAMLLAFIAIHFYLSTVQGQYRVASFLCHMPIFGNILQMILLARFACLFSLVIRSDMPLTKGIELIAKAMANAYFARHVRAMGENITRGASIVNAARECKIFPPIMLQMMAVGEESGSIEELLDQVAVFYEREVDFRLKRLNDYLEPLLLLLIAAMVLLLALGIFLPMWHIPQMVVKQG